MISPLSQSQLSIYLASQGLDENSGNYQQAILFRLPANIDIQRLGKALEAFVAAHPYLLSRITESEGMPCMEESGESWQAQIRQIDSIVPAILKRNTPHQIFELPNVQQFNNNPGTVVNS